MKRLTVGLALYAAVMFANPAIAMENSNKPDLTGLIGLNMANPVPKDKTLLNTTTVTDDTGGLIKEVRTEDYDINKNGRYDDHGERWHIYILKDGKEVPVWCPVNCSLMGTGQVEEFLEQY